LEYAVCGVVPAVAHVQPYLEAVRDGETGLYFTGRKDLTRVLNRLINDPELRTGLSRSARAYVLNERLQSQHGKDRVSFYRGLVSQLGGNTWHGNGQAALFEKYSRLEGAVVDGRHLRLRPTRFEDSVYNGLVTSQISDEKERAFSFFEEASKLEEGSYLPFLYASPVSPDPISSLMRALSRNPRSVKAWILLGEAFAGMGRVKESFESFERAVQIYPEYEIPYLRAAALLEKIGERSQASMLLDRVKTLRIGGPQDHG
jgi:tetratricopeptide (TPR) repeat protein